MDENNSTLQLIARHLVLAVAPLREAVSDLESFQAFMLRIGWQVESLPPEYAALATPVNNLLSALESLGDGAELDEIIELIRAVGDLYRQIDAIASAPDGIPPVDAGEFLAGLAGAVFELLIVEYLAAALPALYNFLQALGIIVLEEVEATATRPGFLATRFLADQIPEVLTNPDQIPERLYGWGTDDVDFDTLSGHLLELFIALKLDAYLTLVEKEFGDAFQDTVEETEKPVEWILKIPLLMDNIDGQEVEIGLGLMELPPEGNKPAGLVLVPLIPSSLDFELAENLRLVIRAGSDISEQFGIMFRPNEIEVRYPFAEGKELPEAGFGVDLVFAPPEPVALFGEPDGTRVQVEGAGAGFELNTDFSKVEFKIRLNVEGLTLIISMNNVDGFLGQLFGGNDLQVPIPLAFSWSNLTSFNFTASAGLAISTTPHLEIGPLTIERFDLQILSTFGSSAPPDLRLFFGVGFSGELGPIHFVAEGIGLKLALVFEEGNAGPFDIDFGFKPPTGLGLAIDGGGFKGGGFLSFDPDNERYAGTLQLEFQDTIALTAIGLLTTRLPGNRPGFSLLIIISAEFTPIQLGFGFTLNGVGGLLGLNRTMKIEALRTGIKNNTLDHILFPTDPVANANRIISDLRQVFPPEERRFVFGPMAKIGWGTPTLISIEMGLLIEVPSPVTIALPGVLKSILPDEDKKLLVLQINFLGVIEFEKQLLSFDASLYESRLLTLTLAGDMALRLSWGPDPNFLLTVGGFHPAYNPPPLDLPMLMRLTVSITPGDNPRIRLETYFAVTSNTVQFGAKLELYAAAGEFNVYGFLAFDVLFQFNPFYFIAQISAGLALRAGSSTIAGVQLDFALSGTTPWNAKGSAKLKILFVTIKVSFNKTWGDRRDTLLPDVVVLPLLKEALQNKQNWEALLPGLQKMLVAIKDLSAIPDVLVHPFGALRISQKVVPLKTEINKFGNAKPSDANHFEISQVLIDDLIQEIEDVKEQFAPAQYQEMSDSQKLARKSFEKMNGGVRMKASDKITASYVVARDVEYEEIIIDRSGFRLLLGIFKAKILTFVSFLKGNAVAGSPLSFTKTASSPLSPSPLSVAQEGFSVVSTADLNLFDENLTGLSQAEAYSFMRSAIRENPQLENQLQVVPNYEVTQP